MHDVVWTDGAKADIEDIWRYIAAHASPDRADDVLQAFDDKVAKLAASPHLGNRPKALLELGIAEYRELHWKPYRIIYGTADKRVLIYCVLDGRRDVNALLQERLLR